MATASKSVVYAATGRRKTSVARVRIVPGTGKVTVNKREFEDYFPLLSLRDYIVKPLQLTEVEGQYDLHVKVTGGGINGQAGAIRHALSRALLVASEEHKAVLKKNGFLVRDARMKERKKPGQPGARKRFQFSKR